MVAKQPEDLLGTKLMVAEGRKNTKPPTLWVGGFAMRCRRRPTLPRSRERSTIGAVGLNDRVRNGNECGPYALVASEITQL